MRINPKIVIRLGDFEEFKREVISSIDREPKNQKTLFIPPKFMPTIFTVERLRLLKAIHAHPDYGTVKLAELLGRKQEAVSRDLAVLRGLRVITDGTPLKIPSKRPFSLNILF